MDHLLSAHLSFMLAAGGVLLAVVLPALVTGLKVGQEQHSFLSGLIAFLSAFLSLQRWVPSPKPTGPSKIGDPAP